MNNLKVLLTGVSGFLGSHTAIQLLEKNYQVLGTIRDIKRADKIKSVIEKHTSRVHNLSFVEADLNDESVWGNLMAGIDYVQHIASPFPRILPKNEEELIIPAKKGTLSILRSSAESSVKRVVLTSSIAAIVYGKSKKTFKEVFDENHWTDVTNRKDSTPYFRSKTIAEKAAWDFVKESGTNLELTTVCPGAILGPVLETDFGTSANIVIKTMDGSSPALPNLGFDMVDVRSVADLLIKSMELPSAAHQRYIASAGYMRFKDVAQVLKNAYPDRKIPSSVFPNFMVRLFSNFDTSLKPILIDLGTERKVDNSKAQKELGWQPISNHKAVLSCAKSVIELGIVT